MSPLNPTAGAADADARLPELPDAPCDPLEERQFLLAVRRLADSLHFGADSSPYRGSGIEFVQSRLYQPGDPVRSMDWRVTGRTGKPHIKEYEAPKRLPVYILLDTSASMCLGSGPVTKYALAVQLAGGLALSALHRVSPAAILGCGERPLHLPPTFSRSRVFQWLAHLRRYRLHERTALGLALRRLASLLEVRSLVFLLSDLHDLDALPALKILAQNHDVVVLQFIDPAERGALRAGYLRAGYLRAEEAETGASFLARSRTCWLDLDATAAALRSAAIDVFPLPIDQPFASRLRLFLERRGRLERGAR